MPFTPVSCFSVLIGDHPFDEQTIEIYRGSLTANDSAE